MQLASPAVPFFVIMLKAIIVLMLKAWEPNCMLV